MTKQATELNKSLARDFGSKAQANANFVLAALGGLRFIEVTVLSPFGLLPANQLVAEGLELVLKACALSQGVKPETKHRLKYLYERLDASDQRIVDTTVKSAIASDVPPSSVALRFRVRG